MKIRRAFKEDIPRLCCIEEKCRFCPKWGEKGFKREFENRVSVTIVLEEKGKVQGFANFWLFSDSVDLNYIAVAKEMRRRLAGSKLVEKVIEYARKNGCRWINLEVNRENLPAVAFYEKIGFEKAGIRPKFYNNQYDALLMKFEVKDEN